MEHENDPKYENLNKELRKLSRKISNEIFNVRESIDFYYGPLEKFMERKMPLFKSRGVANCGEVSSAILYYLKQKGEDAHKIHIQIKKKLFKKPENRLFSDHSFVVIGLKKDAKLTDPKTWGNNAVIVDAWNGVVGKAKEVLDQYQRMFKFNPKKEKIIFTCMDLK